jgi:hypothetical protein
MGISVQDFRRVPAETQSSVDDHSTRAPDRRSERVEAFVEQNGNVEGLCVHGVVREV